MLLLVCLESGHWSLNPDPMRLARTSTRLRGGVLSIFRLLCSVVGGDRRRRCSCMDEIEEVVSYRNGRDDATRRGAGEMKGAGREPRNISSRPALLGRVKTNEKIILGKLNLGGDLMESRTPSGSALSVSSWPLGPIVSHLPEGCRTTQSNGDTVQFLPGKLGSQIKIHTNRPTSSFPRLNMMRDAITNIANCPTPLNTAKTDDAYEQWNNMKLAHCANARREQVPTEGGHLD